MPFITPSTITSAITPIVTPPTAITVISEISRDERRLRKYRIATRRSRRPGQFVASTTIAATVAATNSPLRMSSTVTDIIRAAASGRE